jgi:small basic protein
VIVLIPFIGLVIGVLIGVFLKVEVPANMVAYIPVAILAALDSVFGGFRSGLEKKFDNEIFISGFFGNIIIAIFLTYLGDMLNVPMYLAAVVVFGGRLFDNFAKIRRLLIAKGRERLKHKEE